MAAGLHRPAICWLSLLPEGMQVRPAISQYDCSRSPCTENNAPPEPLLSQPSSPRPNTISVNMKIVACNQKGHNGIDISSAVAYVMIVNQTITLFTGWHSPFSICHMQSQSWNIPSDDKHGETPDSDAWPQIG